MVTQVRWLINALGFIHLLMVSEKWDVKWILRRAISGIKGRTQPFDFTLNMATYEALRQDEPPARENTEVR